MATMPHCDQAVLHAPGECEYCDRYPEWQRAREVWGIAFTGHAPQAGELPCPSEARRPHEVIAQWPGNRPRPTSGLNEDRPWLHGDVPPATLPGFVGMLRGGLSDLSRQAKRIVRGDR